jgi:SAM-dependent methyltransferase
VGVGERRSRGSEPRALRIDFVFVVHDWEKSRWEEHVTEGPPWAILICPHCGGPLKAAAGGATCTDCGRTFPSTATGALDLRLQGAKLSSIDFVLGEGIDTSDLSFAELEMNSEPEVDFDGVTAPYHLDKSMMSHFPRATAPGSLALDLGCGSAIHREVCERAGFEYVGLDIEAPEASVLGDAHALPFREGTFEFVLSIAVLEHIRYPFVAMSQAYRVLKRGGTLLGTVAFLEPFHADSYYHHTHLGVVNTLGTAGFHVERVAPTADWNVLVAQVEMGLFPRMPRRMARVLVHALDALQQAWLRVARRAGWSGSRIDHITRTTGAFFFIAMKP